MKSLAKAGGVLFGLGAAVVGALWLLKDRITGPEPAPVAPGDAPAFRVSPHAADDAPVAGDVAVDDLTAVKGIGPVFKARLAEEGITTFAGLAAVDAAALAEKIDASEAQIADWAEQAATLDA